MILKKSLLFAAIMAFTFAYAQKEGNDVVITKSGKRFYGSLIDKSPGISIKIETHKNHVEVVPWDDVDTVKKVDLAEVTEQRRWRHNKQFERVRKLGFAGEIIYTGYTKLGTRHHYALSTSLGYQFNPYFTLMFGAGGEIGRGNYQVPLFADVRVNFIQRVYSPYFFFSPGYAFLYRSVDRYKDLGYGGRPSSEGLVSKVDGDFYLNTGIGLRYMFKKHFGLSIKAGLRVQKTNYYLKTFDDEGYPIYAPGQDLLFGFNVAIAMQL
jgi:hypothetical protein